MEEHHFPVYRALTNGLSLFRIESETVFTEVQRIGRRYAIFRVEAYTYPERLRIADLLACMDGSVSPCDHATFDAWLSNAGRRP
jgi:hypothetical protein